MMTVDLYYFETAGWVPTVVKKFVRAAIIIANPTTGRGTPHTVTYPLDRSDSLTQKFPHRAQSLTQPILFLPSLLGSPYVRVNRVKVPLARVKLNWRH